MKESLINLSVFFAILTLIGCQTKKGFLNESNSTVIETKHNKEISDPFRHLETDNVQGDYLSWIQKEKSFSEKTIGRVQNDFINGNIDTNYIDYIDLYINKKGEYWYLNENKRYGTNSLYFREKVTSKEKVVIDPSLIDTTYSINYYKFSWDEKYIAVGLTKQDREFSTIRIFDRASMSFTEGEAPNSFPNGLGGIEWLPDNSGFLYTYIPVIDSKKQGYLYNSKIKKFNLNTGRLLDEDIFSITSSDSILFKEQSFPIAYILNSNKEYLIAQVANESIFRNTYRTKTSEISNGAINWELLWKDDDKVKNFDSDSIYYYFFSSKRNPNYELCRTLISAPDFENPEIIYEPGNSVLTEYKLTSDGVYVATSYNGVRAELLKVSNGKTEKLELPYPSGSLRLYSLSSQDPELWISIKGWTIDPTRFYYDHKDKSFHNVDINIGNEILENTIVNEIEIPGHDGVKIPVSIIQLESNVGLSNQRVFLTSYGAYGTNYNPWLNDYTKKWLSYGGTCVVAHIRGGGEKGDDWHIDGMKDKKENSWLDLISTAEFLIANDYTSPDLLTIRGVSAGAIANGMAIMERPDLFKAAVFKVGILNPSRAEYGKTGKNGIQEFGTIEKQNEFYDLLKMDPYENIKDNVNYPAMYITAGTNDLRLSYWHSTKFAAKLKSRKAQKNEILLDIYDGGHGIDANAEFKNKETNKIISFLLWQTGHPDFQPE
jgi:prolyl oligopeptidase